MARTRGLDPCTRRASLNQFRWEKWRKSTQGRGVKTFTDRLNCRWLHDGLCDRRRCAGAFIFASRLRTQTLPYGKSLVQGRGKSIPSCRACGEGAETISHILKNRLSTTQMRIRRHNMEIDVVKKRIQKEGYVVLNKPRVVSHQKDQLLRPGLCAKKDGKAMVLERLAIPRNDKIKKYAPHGDGFWRYIGCDDLKVNEVVVGARRAITQQMAVLSVLGLGPGEMNLMQKKAVEGSWAIFKWFMGWKSPSMRRSRKRPLHKT